MVLNFVLETIGCWIVPWINLTCKGSYICIKNCECPLVLGRAPASYRTVDWSPTELAAVDFRNATILFLFPSHSFYPYPEFCFIPATNLCCQGSEDGRDLEEEPFKTSSGELGAILHAHHSRWSGYKECVLEENLSNGANWIWQENEFAALEAEFGLSMCFSSVTA